MSGPENLNINAKISFFQTAINAQATGTTAGHKVTHDSNSSSKGIKTPQFERTDIVTTTRKREFSRLSPAEVKLIHSAVDDILSNVASKHSPAFHEVERGYSEPTQSLAFELFNNGIENTLTTIHSKVDSALTIDDFVKENEITNEMIEADAKMLGISPDDAKAQIVARYKELEKLGLNPNITKGSLSERCRITGYEPSLVLLIEGDIGKISQKQDNLADDKTSTRREYNQVKFEGKKDELLVINHLTLENRPFVLIHERFLGAGTSKEARAASDYFSIQSETERGNLVDVRLKKMHDPNIRMQKQQEVEEELHEDFLGTGIVVYDDVEDVEKPFADKKYANEVSDKLEQHEAAEMRKEIEIELQFMGTEGFIPSMILFDNGDSADAPITLKPLAGFSLEQITGTNGQVIREKQDVIDIEKFLDTIRMQATDKECEQGLRMFANISEALSVMHDANLVNNDFKPQNCLILSSGKAILTDFGTVTKFHEEGPMAGTLNFMSPQALSGTMRDKQTDQIIQQSTKKDPSMDVWSFGISLQQFYNAVSGSSDNDIPTFKAFGLPNSHYAKREALEQEANDKIDGADDYLIRGELLLEGKDSYSTNFPEPDQNETPFLHLCWQCTRFAPEERPSMKEVSAFINGHQEAIMRELLNAKQHVI